MNPRLLFLPLVALCLLPFAFADVIMPNPIFLASGLILAVFGINFSWNFVVSFFASKLFGEKRMFEEVSVKKLFSILLWITVIGLVVDVISIMAGGYLCNLMNPQTCYFAYQMGSIGFIFSFVVAFVFLFVTDFLIIRAGKVSTNKAVKYSSILAILTNPVIGAVIISSNIIFVGVIVIVVLFGWAFASQKKIVGGDESRIFSKWGFIVFISLVAGIGLFFVSSFIFLPPAPPHYYGSARDNIANTLNAVKNGGSQASQNFALIKDQALTSKQFSKDGFDQHSIVFATRGISEDLIKVTTTFGDEGVSQFVYNGVTTFNSKASVYCEATGSTLKAVVEGVNLNADEDIIGLEGISLCGVDENEGMYQPCCLVVIKRA
ncbi:MAG: hypothetical protein WC308_00945 [archaeon]|jgi:NADH:ubiquinone oxidoreductase subunit 6 (subunit J)